MNFTEQWTSAKAMRKELRRALSESRFPFVQSIVAEVEQGGPPVKSLLQTLRLVKELSASGGTASAEYLVKDALQGLSSWIIAVRNGDLPSSSVGTEQARRLAAFLAEQAQSDDSRRRASELVTQLTLPAYEWLSRTLVEHQLASVANPLREHAREESRSGNGGA